MSLNNLKRKNPDSKDNNISLEEESHTYHVNGKTGYLSVTTFIHQQFWPFNADRIIGFMMKSKKWPQNKLYGKTKEEIKELWKKNGIEAAVSGTKMHYDIECFYNGKFNNNDSIEFEYFKQFYEDHKELKPYRTEMLVYDEELKFAGAIDMLFENEDGSLMIYDWKRCKNIEKKPRYGKYSKTKAINHVPDTNYWHYCLQLNTYEKILEKNYNKKVTDMYLICLHPNQSQYLKIKVVDLSEEVDKLFVLRKEQLKNI